MPWYYPNNLQINMNCKLEFSATLVAEFFSPKSHFKIFQNIYASRHGCNYALLFKWLVKPFAIFSYRAFHTQNQDHVILIAIPMHPRAHHVEPHYSSGALEAKTFGGEHFRIFWSTWHYFNPSKFWKEIEIIKKMRFCRGYTSFEWFLKIINPFSPSLCW